MKKSLIALAVLAASGASFAQSSVTVYGVADINIQKFKGSSAAMESGGLSGSRLGFKGTEDLGGGLKANFVLEHGFNLDTGAQGAAGKSFNRQAYVGFSGGFGEIKLGNTYTAYDDISGAANPVFDSLLSPTAVWASGNYTARPGNNFYYASPTVGGVSGALSFNVKEAGTAVSSFHAKYEGGPVYAGLGYQKEGDTKFTRLNATYDLGAAKLLAGYGNTKAAGGKTTDLSIGADFPVSSALTLSAGYASSKEDGAARASGISLGMLYALSKRTTVYGGFIDTKNSSSAPDSGYALGLKHAF